LAIRIRIRDIKSQQLLQGLRILKWIWIAFLAWIVVGGTIGVILEWTGFVGPFCQEAGQDNTYPVCEPCKLHGSVFGVFEANECPNTLTKNSLEFGIAWPRLFVASLSIFVFIFVDLLYQVSPVLPALVLIPAAFALLARTLIFNFLKNKHSQRGLHRGLLAGWLALATILAVQW